MRDLETIENERVQRMKELKEAQSSQYIVEDKILRLQKDILKLQSEKKELEITSGRGRHNIRQLNLDIKLLTNEFWSLKNG